MLQAPNLAEEPARVRTRISCLWAHFSAVGAKRAATFASNTMRFGNLDSRSVIVARAFFHAATKLSDDDEEQSESLSESESASAAGFRMSGE